MPLNSAFTKSVTIEAGSSTSDEITTERATGMSYSLDLGSGWTTARMVIQGHNHLWDRWEILAYVSNGVATILELPIDTNGFNIQLPAEMWQIGTYNKIRIASINSGTTSSVNQDNLIKITVRFQQG